MPVVGSPLQNRVLRIPVADLRSQMSVRLLKSREERPRTEVHWVGGGGGGGRSGSELVDTGRNVFRSQAIIKRSARSNLQVHAVVLKKIGSIVSFAESQKKSKSGAGS